MVCSVQAIYWYHLPLFYLISKESVHQTLTELYNKNAELSKFSKSFEVIIILLKVFLFFIGACSRIVQHSACVLVDVEHWSNHRWLCQCHTHAVCHLLSCDTHHSHQSIIHQSVLVLKCLDCSKIIHEDQSSYQSIALCDQDSLQDSSFSIEYAELDTLDSVSFV